VVLERSSLFPNIGLAMPWFASLPGQAVLSSYDCQINSNGRKKLFAFSSKKAYRIGREDSKPKGETLNFFRP